VHLRDEVFLAVTRRVDAQAGPLDDLADFRGDVRALFLSSDDVL